MPDGTTTNAQVATSSAAPLGERPNKTPIFIAGFGDTRAFLAWLLASCPGGLTAQLKSEKLMVDPSTADGFRAAVSALRSLDGGKGVSFHTLTLPEDRCVRLLVKNLGRNMPESVVREEVESLNIRVQGVTQLRSGRRDQDPPRTAFLPPTSMYEWRADPRCQGYDLSLNSAACECRWNRTWPRKAHCNASAASALDTRSETAVTHPGASRVVVSTSPEAALPRGNSPCAVAAGETTRRTTGAALSGRKRSPHLQRRRPIVAVRAPSQPTLPLRKTAGKVLCRAEGPGRGVESRSPRGRVVKATIVLPTPNHPSQPVTEALEQPKVTATRKTARPQKSQPKTSAASEPAAGKSKRTAAASVKTAAAKLTTPNLVVPNQSSTSPLEKISDLLDHLPLDACMELTRRFLICISSLPTRTARPRAVLKTVILFVAEYGSTP
jgi:hypothetical protein